VTTTEQRTLDIVPFPFTWNFPYTKSYVTIQELPGEEKNLRSCSLCGKEAKAEFAKIINDRKTLVCRACAEKYVTSAIKFNKRWAGK